MRQYSKEAYIEEGASSLLKHPIFDYRGVIQKQATRAGHLDME